MDVNRLLLGSAVIAAAAVLLTSASIVFAGGSAPADSREAVAPAAEDGKKKVRYRGESKSGQPIRFRLVERGSRAKVKHLAVDVVTECWADQDHDGNADKIVAHITGLHGRVLATGEFEVYYAPDEDTEYSISGRLVDGKARLNVVVGGWFGPDGIPNAGTLQCDNWGALYKAKPRAR
jgi:hypothetical protein